MESNLPEKWWTHVEATLEVGTHWLRQNNTVLLQIPIAIVPQTANYLFNPAHRHASAFRIVEVLKYPFDARLKL